MTDRERLIDLIKEFGDDIAFCDICKRPDSDCDGCRNEMFADYLIEHGVIVLPCKPGKILYCESAIKGYITSLKAPDDDCISKIGKFSETEIFLTREEAEKATKERGSK